ncbi:MAG: flagellar biosynthetic protein FliO [Jatrophihabitantaceae bacterium]
MNTIAIIGRMLLALVVVLGIMWCLARWARKPLGVGKADRVMAVLARQQLSRTSSVAVLRVMDRALVLGVTENGIRLLTETELAPIEDALVVESAPPRAWSRMRPAPLELASGMDSEPDQDELLAVGADRPVPAERPATAERPASAGRIAQAGRGKLDGSVLSPNTWRQLLSAARELTVRR